MYGAIFYGNPQCHQFIVNRKVPITDDKRFLLSNKLKGLIQSTITEISRENRHVIPMFNFKKTKKL
ncbi:hypothetical protein GCM10022393_38420 [Aquimarina addita]|uniref:Uncharacterized protein n=1 Tax=Aquimarina addita TaxID=870485 RepID=A0ABP6US86_9FLAO